MARGNESVYAALIVIAIVIAPFVWLYNAVGEFWFWTIVIAAIGFIVAGFVIQAAEKRKKSASRKVAKVTMWQTPTTTATAATANDRVELYRIKNAVEIEMAWLRGDYDWARDQLQKIAYTLVGKSVPQETKDEFTRLMSEFAKEDPLYRSVMDRLLPAIKENPGMTQSQIYKGESDSVKEQVRYVLYFADVLGDIRREKKGNSYRLYPPGIVVDSSAK